MAKARDGYLKKHPICEYHKRWEMIVAAVVVDHKKPHRGDMDLFWDKNTIGKRFVNLVTIALRNSKNHLALCSGAESMASA